MGELLLKAENLQKRYYKGKQSIEAVKDVSFTIEKGTCLGLIGESGSGKSTVANLIAGLEKADGGKIRMKNLDASVGTSAPEYEDLLGKLPPARRKMYGSRIQMVFQNPRLSFNPAMTIGQGLEEAVRYYTKWPKQRREEEARRRMEQVGLKAEYLHKRPRELSGGECQRAAIARALMIRPALLICDEATSALDVSIQAQVMEILDRIRRETGLTMLFISHDLALVSTICDHVAVMYRGGIVEAGTTEEILRNSTQAYTRELLDSVLGRVE